MQSEFSRSAFYLTPNPYHWCSPPISIHALGPFLQSPNPAVNQDTPSSSFLLGTSPVSLLGGVPIAEGTYNWFAGGGYNGTSKVVDQASWDYSIKFEVRDINEGTVPEPSIIALMGLGLAGIGYGCRKRKTMISS